MKPSKDALTWQEWVDSTNSSTRKLVLKEWAEANGAKSPQELLDRIFLDGEGAPTPYSTALKFLNKLREEGRAIGTIALYRSILGGEGKKGHGSGFFLSVFGEENYSVKKFDRLVPLGEENYTETEKRPPEDDELRNMLRNANVRDRALLGGLACGAMRISEWLSRRMSELERRPDGHGALHLRAGDTKKRYARTVFLTKEVMDWIDAYHTALNVNSVDRTGRPHPVTPASGSDWIFPGEKGDHLDKVSGYRAIKDMFVRAGCVDNEAQGYIYSPHSMRTFAENHMAKCGLNDKFVRLITAHTSKTERAYKGKWEEIEAEWVEKCSEKMTWLTETVVVTQKDPEQQKEIDTLKERMEAQQRLLKELTTLLASVDLSKLPLTEQGKALLEKQKALPELPEQSDTKPVSSGA